MNEDFRAFFELLRSHRCAFLLIGGMAYNVYAPPRSTKDVDLWVRPTPRNLERLRAAMVEFGLDVATLDLDELRREPRVLMIGRAPNRIDVLMRPAGLDWSIAWPRRSEVDYGGVSIPVLSIVDLIAAKTAAGRPQDLVDVAKLRRVAARRARRRP